MVLGVDPFIHCAGHSVDPFNLETHICFLQFPHLFYFSHVETFLQNLITVTVLFHLGLG